MLSHDRHASIKLWTVHVDHSSLFDRQCSQNDRMQSGHTSRAIVISTALYVGAVRVALESSNSHMESSTSTSYVSQLVSAHPEELECMLRPMMTSWPSNNSVLQRAMNCFKNSVSRRQATQRSVTNVTTNINAPVSAAAGA